MIKHSLTGAAFFLAGAFGAAAEEGPESYPVTHECAEQALRDTFEEPFEIVVQEEGVGGFHTMIDKDGISATLSSIVSIAPNGNIASLNVQLNYNSPTTFAYGSVTIDYTDNNDGTISVESEGGNVAPTIAESFSKKLEEGLKQCAPQMLSSLSYPVMGHG